MRDKLALERTALANERTFLAYLRTALSLLAAGAVMLHFFVGNPTIVGVGWSLVGAGAVVLPVGIYRFFRVRRRLRD